eukprot:6491317-Amphidinium_carterae.1
MANPICSAADRVIALATAPVCPTIYRLAWERNHPAVIKVLTAWGFGPSRDSANTVREICSDEAAMDMLALTLQAQLPPHLRQESSMQAVLSALSTAAMDVAPSASLPSELMQSAPGQVPDTSELPLGPEFTRWRPRDTYTEPRNVRDQELAWAHSWRQKLLSLLQPHMGDLPLFHQAANRDKAEQELHDVFGSSRWATLRQHFLNLRNMLALSPELPISQDQCHSTLAAAEHARVAPSKIKSWANTMVWLSNTGGTDLSATALHRKRDAIRNRLASTIYQEPKRAWAPDVDVVKALEKVCASTTSWVHAYGAGHFRFLLGASARFDDGQHTRADTLVQSSTSLEFKGWQSKTMDITRDKAKVLPLIAPLRSFSEHLWWMPYTQAHNRLEELLPNRDFLLPKPAPDFLSFQDGPCKREQALTWLRMLLQMGGESPQRAAKVTLPSLRVFAPDLAYSLGVPRDERQYLGRWAQESTADIYTRNHRAVITGIWDKLMASTTPVMEHDTSEDIHGAEYGFEVPPSPVPSDLGHEGPHRIALNQRTQMLHILDAADRAIGCGWKPTARSKICLLLTQQDWDARSQPTRQCVWCFQQASLPQGWDPDEPSRYDDSDDTSSSSDAACP